MTAEIAILNRIGVALAADSAVTISSRQGDPKVYNSADKLFELHGSEPVGIMIYGSAEFMGIPAETIVKGFCASSYNTPQPELAGYARQFQDYMRRELPIERGTMINRLAAIAVDALAQVKLLAEHEYETVKAKAKARPPKAAVFMAKRIQEIVAARLALLRDQPRIVGLDQSNLPAEFPDIVREAISTVLGDGMIEKMPPILELLELMILAQVSLGGEIGFVFAGFGTDQIFPAIEAFECDLALVDALRIKLRGDAQISNEQVAVISPFAQAEMVHRFMDGVDATYNTFIAEAVRGSLNNFGNEVARRFGAESHPDYKRIDKELEALRDDLVAELENAAFLFRTSAFRDRVLEVVQFMPKAELAEMAESLVNLTSIKRRVTAEHETVGGPIDVAFVSKHDGFTWVRRKGVAPKGPGQVFSHPRA